MSDAPPPGRGPALTGAGGLRDVGSLLGTYVHEANNRLATLQEGLGLLGDLLAAAKGGGKDAVRECARAAAGLERQVAQFGALTGRLDGFARRLGGGEGAALHELVDDLLALTERTARQGRVRVERDFAPGAPPLARDAAGVEILLLRLLLRAYALLPGDGVLRVSTRRAQGRTGVGLSLSPAAGPLDEEWLRDAARGLDGGVEAVPGGLWIWFADLA